MIPAAGGPEDDPRTDGEAVAVGDVERCGRLLLSEKAGVAPSLESGGGYRTVQRSATRLDGVHPHPTIVVVYDDGTAQLAVGAAGSPGSGPSPVCGGKGSS